MRRLLPFVLAALLLAPLSTHATLQAQGVPSAVRLLPRDTAPARADSVAVARHHRAIRACERRESMTHGIGGALGGGALGATFGAVPAAVLSQLHQHVAARVALYTPTVAFAAIAGTFGALLGPLSCEGP